ncbi:MAG: uroporphyrinogen-III C-methyltransferase [Rhodospirillaceae bacterium]|nr:uroporphyrinogen-III C-methyltransferase [Rhodospirillaceae bacterium]
MAAPTPYSKPNRAAATHHNTGLSAPQPVLIVGAGAGDAGDLTLRALAAIQSADVIFYDDLVDASILGLIPARTERVFVGKRAGQPSTPQNEIHALVTKAASTGERVVRLKGGDPFLFGRGSEEADVLAQSGFESEVVPGLSAAFVCAASTGIPLTDRRHAAQVTFITATRSNGELNDMRGLAGAGRTLVIYMGARLAPHIAQALQGDAVADETPVVIIANGGRITQRVTETTVGALASTTAAESSGPALLIIGDVVRARVATTRFPYTFNETESRHV